jgi:hypothetical protein
MSSGKGKGRANGVEDAENPARTEQPSQTPDSVLRRFVASASLLSQSALAPPSSRDLIDHASTAPGSSGKDQQAGGSSSSAWAESSRVAHGRPSLPIAQRASYQQFREGRGDQHIQNSEAEFSSFLDGIDSFTSSANAFQQSTFANSGPPRNLVGDLFVREYTVNGLKGEPRYTSVEKQQQNDGAEVLAILSDPRIATNSIDAFHEEEASYWQLTQEHRSVLLAKMKDHEGFLNRLSSAVLDTGSFMPFINNIEEESYFYFGRRMEREEAQQAWMREWGAVLTHYTDEVWGDLLPLVEEAREEVKAIEGDSTALIIEQSKALRRLGLILGHLWEP